MDVRIEITPEIMAAASRADRLRGQWDSGPGLSRARLGRLREAARVRSAAASARMAGVRVDEAEVAELLREGAPATADEVEIAGYARAAAAGLPPTGVLEADDLGRLHATMLGASGRRPAPSPWRAGQLHRELFDAGGTATGRVVATLPPRYAPEQTERLLTWLELELREGRSHPLPTVLVFALGLIAVSPYARGNGRLARLVVPCLLERAGYRFVAYSSLEARLEERRDAYFDALDRSQPRLWSGEADVSPWIGVWLEAIAAQHDALERVLCAERAARELSPLQRSILEAVREHGTVDAGMLLRTTGANRNTLKDNLRRMVRDGLLDRSGERRGTRYALAGAAPAVGER